MSPINNKDHDERRFIPGFRPLAPIDDVDAQMRPDHAQYGVTHIPPVAKNESGGKPASPAPKKESDDTAREEKGIILVGSGESSGVSEVDDNSIDPRSGFGKARSFKEGIALVQRRHMRGKTGNIPSK